MASEIGSVYVKVGAKIDELQSKLKQAQRDVGATADKMKSIGTKMTLGITVPVIGIGVASIKAASDMEESTNKMKVVFGSASKTITKFADGSSEKLGLTEQAAIDATATFGNLFGAMGMGQSDMVDMSTGLVQLAADLASFNNIPVGEALEKLRSGIVGEIEPVRTLGIDISEMAVQTKALEMGLAGSSKELTQQDKVLARYKLIMEQTTTAQGDYVRTSDGLANSVRTLQSDLGDLAAEIGTELIPMAKDAVGVAKDLLGMVKGLPEPVKKAGLAFAGITAALGPMLMIVGQALPLLTALGGGAGAATGIAGAGAAAAGATTAVGGLTLGFTGLAGVVATGGVLLVGMAAVVGLIIASKQASEEADEAFKNLKTGTMDMGDAMTLSAGRGAVLTEKLKENREEQDKLKSKMGELQDQIYNGTNPAMADMALGMVAAKEKISDAERALNDMYLASHDADGTIRSLTEAEYAAVQPSEDAAAAYVIVKGALVKVGDSAATAAGKVAELSQQLANVTGYDLGSYEQNLQLASQVQHGGAGADKMMSRAGGMGQELPGYAAGGIVTKPTIALIGEAGPEAIIPMGALQGASGSNGTSVVQSILSGLSGATGGTPQVGFVNSVLPSLPSIPASDAPSRKIALISQIKDLTLQANEQRQAIARTLDRMSGQLYEINRNLAPGGAV